MAEERRAGSMKTVLWVCVLVLGIWLFFEGLEARGERLESDRLVDDLSDRKISLRKDIDRSKTEIELLRRDDPAAVKGALQRHDRVERGRVAVDPPGRDR